MPRGDRTGPRGMGAQTGRGIGYCAGNPGAGFMYPGPGFGFGRGLGIGRGFDRGFGLGRGRGWHGAGYGHFWGYPYPPAASYPTFQPFNEEQEKAFLDDQLGQIKKRLEELKK